MTAMADVTVDELRDLFTGVPAEGGGWQTSPCYTVPLAVEIAKRTDARSEHQLRTVLFDTSAPDDIPGAAIDVIKIAVEKYEQLRTDHHRQPNGL